MATIDVYPREGTTYPDAAGVPITAAGARVDESTYIDRALRKHHLFNWDPLGIYLPEDRTSDEGAGDVYVIQNQGQFAMRSFTTDVAALEILGCLTGGDGGGATVKRITSNLPVVGLGGNRLGCLTTSDSATWVYVPDARGVNAAFFGASPSASASVNRAAIQNAIDFDIQYARTGTVYIPGGRYEIDDTIHLGYGASIGSPLNSITLEGNGNKIVDESPFGGTALVANFSDRPAIAISGARASKVKRIAIFGKNQEWIESRQLGVNTSTQPSNLVSDWVDPTLSATAASRYAPYAGIAVDPYCGSAPSPAYPNVNFPPFMSGTAQYGKTPSSDVKLDEVSIIGFVVGLAVKPCDSDGNGDFVSIRESFFSHNVYCISAGHTQCRLLNADNTLFVRFHSGIVNTVHGKQQGKISGEFSNCLFEACQQWFDLPDATRAGPIKFTNCYSEECWRIGRYAGGAANNQPLVFETCQWSFSLQDDTVRGSPDYTLESSGTSPITFNGCSFGLYKSVMVFGGSMEGYTFNDCAFEGSNPRTNQYEKIAHNYTANGVMFVPFFANRPRAFSGKTVTHYNALTGSADDNRLLRSPVPGGRSLNINAWCTSVTPINSFGKIYNTTQFSWIAVDKAVVVSSVVGTTLTVSGFAHIPQLAGGAPGDVIFDSLSGTTFFVRSLSGGTITAEAQNNVRNGALMTSYVNASGTLWMGNARIYTPQFYLRGTLSASTLVSNVARPDGFGGGLSTWIANGDYVFNSGQVLDDFVWSPTLAGQTISGATSGSPGSFSVGSNPIVLGSRDLDFFVLQPPANV